MQENLDNKNIEADLQELEERIVSDLGEIGPLLNLDFFPENMGMILAAEGIESRFSLGNTIVSAMWTAELTDEQLFVISEKIGNNHRLIGEDLEGLKKDLLAVGRLLTRLQIDMKEVFGRTPELKVKLLTNLMNSFKLIFDEYKKEESGAGRFANVREYFELSLNTSIRNLKYLGQADQAIDPNTIRIGIERYQILLDEIQKLDPEKQLERKKMEVLIDQLHTLFKFSFGAEVTIATDEEFTQVRDAFSELNERVAS
jgi:hypothetical protein